MAATGLESGEFARPNDDPTLTIWLGGLVAVVFVAALVAWASLAELARASVAPSTVVVEGSRRPIQHREGGPVGEVLVAEGAAVEAGQVLVRLDLSEVRAEVDVRTVQRLQALAQLARFRAEAADAAAIAFPPALAGARADAAVGPLLAQQEALFEARRKAFDGGRHLLTQQIAGFREQIRGLEGQVERTKDQIAFIDEELVGLRALLEKGLTPKSRVLLLQREAARLGSELEGLGASIATAENEIRRADLQIEQLLKERREEVARGIAEQEALLAEIEPTLAAARDRLSRVDLVSPVAGRVLNLAVHGPGASLLPGQVVAEIVPAGQPLVVKAMVEPNDIELVEPGQPVELHVLAYRSRYQSILHGRLESISADRLEDPVTRMPYYSAVISIDPQDLAAAEMALLPGMNVTSVIITGKRTVMDYFLDPIYHVYDFALKED